MRVNNLPKVVYLAAERPRRSVKIRHVQTANENGNYNADVHVRREVEQDPDVGNSFRYTPSRTHARCCPLVSHFEYTPFSVDCACLTVICSTDNVICKTGRGKQIRATTTGDVYRKFSVVSSSVVLRQM